MYKELKIMKERYISKGMDGIVFICLIKSFKEERVSRHRYLFNFSLSFCMLRCMLRWSQNVRPASVSLPGGTEENITYRDQYTRKDFVYLVIYTFTKYPALC